MKKIRGAQASSSPQRDLFFCVISTFSSTAIDMKCTTTALTDKQAIAPQLYLFILLLQLRKTLIVDSRQPDNSFRSEAGDSCSLVPGRPGWGGGRQLNAVPSVALGKIEGLISRVDDLLGLAIARARLGNADAYRHR